MNELKHIADFRKVLKNYQLSDPARGLLKHTSLVLLVGPTSSGRNTIINTLLKTGKYHFIVSDTTRKPRVNNGILEQDGREYWFRSEEDMLADLRNGQFLEAAIIHDQQVSGMSMRELTSAADEQTIAINEIEVVGAENVYTTKPDTMFFFVIPPSFDEWMVRMRTRGELPNEEIRRRLTSAVHEIEIALECNYYRFIVNDTFMHTARDIDRSIEEGTVDATAQLNARQVAAELLNDTKEHLGSMA